MAQRRALLAPLALVMLLGCGGGFTPDTPVASPLDYTDPAGSGWRLVKDPSSTPERLVLALVGPAGLQARGVALTLLLDETHAAFTPFPDGAWAQSTGVFPTHAPGKPDEAKGLQLRPAIRMGNKLTVGFFQKDLAEPPKDCGRPLLRIALAGRQGSAPGIAVPLLVRKATLISADLGSGKPAPIAFPVALGRLMTK